MTLLHVMTVPMSLSFLRGQASYMVGHGFDVHALSSHGDALSAFGTDEGIPVHAVDMARDVTPLRDLRAVAGIHRQILMMRPAIVHAHTPKAGLLGMLAATAARVPVRVFHMRGLLMMGATGHRRALLREAERLTCTLAHRVLCVSHSLRALAIEEGLCAADKIRVLRSGSGQGVDAVGRFDPSRLPAGTRAASRERLRIPADARVVGFVGRVVRDKGAVELADAWRCLRQEFPDAHLLIVGPFESRDAVPEIEQTFRSDARVHLAGTDWDTAPLYAAMDVVALPTYREGFPNVPLEAAAMRVPVVATKVTGCVDAVADGSTGTLVPPRNAEALASALRRYLLDAEMRTRHGDAARTRVLQDYRREDLWEAIRQEYESLLRERRPGYVTPAGLVETTRDRESIA